MDNKTHKKVIQEKAKLYEKFSKKRNAFNETAYKAYKSLFEAIKHKSKQNPLLTKDTPIQVWHKEKMDYYERNNW